MPVLLQGRVDPFHDDIVHLHVPRERDFPQPPMHLPRQVHGGMHHLGPGPRPAGFGAGAEGEGAGGAASAGGAVSRGSDLVRVRPPMREGACSCLGPPSSCDPPRPKAPALRRPPYRRGAYSVTPLPCRERVLMVGPLGQGRFRQHAEHAEPVGRLDGSRASARRGIGSGRRRNGRASRAASGSRSSAWSPADRGGTAGPGSEPDRGLHREVAARRGDAGRVEDGERETLLPSAARIAGRSAEPVRPEPIDGGQSASRCHPRPPASPADRGRGRSPVRRPRPPRPREGRDGRLSGAALLRDQGQRSHGHPSAGVLSC